ncbi:HNH endonuclease signature motif containing protein [Moraxella sp. ZY200743]|uniref:HNH endonuclease signature motif containing protein n=1 Tax=Moraxella sp. ZY200743 TaxID=2911970 RepID=UPI003D7CB3E2
MLNDLTHDTLTQTLYYDPATGHFTWRIKPSKNIHAGVRAGRVDSSTGYRYINIQGKRYAEHRLAWFYIHGTPPKHLIDHINHDRADNRINNLRQVTVSENARNRAKNTQSRTQEVGIWYNKRTRKYVAQIRLNGRKVFQKSFDDIDDAIIARKQRAIELGFHENHGN